MYIRIYVCIYIYTYVYIYLYTKHVTFSRHHVHTHMSHTYMFMMYVYVYCMIISHEYIIEYISFHMSHMYIKYSHKHTPMWFYTRRQTHTHTQTHKHTRHAVFTYGLGRRLRACLVWRLSSHASRACRCSIQRILSCSRVRDCVSVVFLRFIKPHQLVIRAWVWFEFGDTQLSEGVEGLG